MRLSPHKSLWLGAWLALGVALIPPPAGRAMAQAIADQLATCKKENGNTQTRITACTWIIDKAKDDEDIRAEAYLQRGVLYEVAGDKAVSYTHLTLPTIYSV